MVANDLCKIIFSVNILHQNIYCKDKLIWNVTEKFQCQASLRNLWNPMTSW